MNKLEAVNKMLEAISQTAVNSLSGTLNSRTVLAKSILEDTVQSVQLSGYYFNTEYNYPLYPDENGEIYLNSSILRVDINNGDEYVQHGLKLYDKTNHTYKINKSLTATIIRELDFENLPPIAQRYIVMTAANEFVAKVKQSKEMYAYSSQAVLEAKVKLEEAEIDTGNFNILDNFNIRRSL